MCCWVLAAPGLAQSLPTQDVPLASGASEQEEFFEQRVRPALIEHCYECHAADTEASGGLLLDSAAGWQAGGDSGPAIQPGQPAESLLIRAVSYEDPELKMPPEGKLPPDVIRALTTWIAQGAQDPRLSGEGPIRPASNGLSVEQAQSHWAYRPLEQVATPTVAGSQFASPVDYFIDRRLLEMKLTAAPAADRDTLVRRLYFDLVGLPPPANASELWFHPDDATPEIGYRRLVDGLLNSSHYGEHFARKWMDVARYAESITLRGFVLPEAWRYRDYLIQAYLEDRPFDQMIREQIAGDLLEHPDVRERQMQLTATSFLAMGNNNLEQQDKTQLEMDYIDEQLETIGRAFLAQTLGCARCHDHKFDPIPTRDYYALAGIMRSAVALEHANLSMWLEEPLPLPEDQQEYYDRLTNELEEIDQRIEAIQAELPNQPAKDKKRFVSVEQLQGTVVDDRDAKLVGKWKESSAIGSAVGEGYRHDENTPKGMATATFEPAELAGGNYEVRMAYSASTNRASNVLVYVFSAEGEAELTIDQRRQPTIDGLWVSLGHYRFEQDGQAFVLVTNEGSDGHVIVDAIQFLPVGEDVPKEVKPEGSGSLAEGDDPKRIEQNALASELKELESRRKELEGPLATRPRYLTVVEKLPPMDIPIHIRGDVHNLGEVVPRGFLTALAMPADATRIPEDSSGRRQLADWMSSSSNPLTARVYANRVWSWLMGQGLVASQNNFGTTGTPPTHPELLDWLATELIQSGWSTKHLVRTIVMSEAYRRQISGNERADEVDPTNHFYWRGHSRKIPAEALRDAMLQVSGELDAEMGGSLIRSGTKADYDYQHESTRRSIYHPVFRNSLPELFEVFDFADPSVSIGQRPRSTVATQPLILVNHPWVIARAQATAQRLNRKWAGFNKTALIRELYLECFFRLPTDDELGTCFSFLTDGGASLESDRLQILVHSLFASLDFRYLQ